MALFNIRAKLSSRITQYLNGVIGSDGKRAVFLASLAARLRPDSDFDKKTLEKLNTLLRLTKDNSALGFPFALSKVIWQGKTGTEIFEIDPATGELTQETIERMAQNAIRQMPAWLFYGEEADIQKDVGELLQNRYMVFAA